MIPEGGVRRGEFGLLKSLNLPLNESVKPEI